MSKKEFIKKLESIGCRKIFTPYLLWCKLCDSVYIRVDVQFKTCYIEVGSDGHYVKYGRYDISSKGEEAINKIKMLRRSYKIDKIINQ